MNKKYSGFTLVEMLIVMGIIIILTVVGITAGRFAINRANDVAHRNAVDQLFTSLQAYYTDEREYPSSDGDCGTSTVCTPELLVGPVGENDGYLVPYIDKDAFDGGSAATYWYFVGGDGGDQSVLVCVSLRGLAAENKDRDDGEIYCNGNGFGAEDIPPVTGKDNLIEDLHTDSITVFDETGTTGSDWDGGWL